MSSDVTIAAMMKAAIDEGKDYIDMYVPILMGALHSSGEHNFAERDLARYLSNYLSAHVPQSVVLTVAHRCVKRGHLRRDAGRWTVVKATPIESEKKALIEESWSSFVASFAEFAKAQGVVISLDDAQDVLLASIRENKTGLVLDPGHSTATATARMPVGRAIVGKFFVDRVSGDKSLQDAVESVVTGLVLRSTLFLADSIATPKRLDRLTVYIDSKLAFGLLGLGDEYECNAVQQGVLLVQRNGVALRIFDKTLDEMRRILQVYQNHLGTLQGIRTLHSTRLTSYFLHSKSSPGDVAEISATLEKRLRGHKITTQRTPDRVPSLTLGEAALEEKLASSDAGFGSTDRRVVHDVDCVAAILTLRGGKARDRLEDSGYVFSTLGWMTAKNIHEWYTDQGGKGYAPCVHQSVLTTLSWMHSPSAGDQWLKAGIGSIAALASTVSEKAWSKFKVHVRKLADGGGISSDEEIMLLASKFAEPAILDEALARGDNPDEPDVTTIAEAVARVRQQEHQRLVQIEEDLGSARTANAIREARRIQFARRFGEFFSWIPAAIFAVIALAGLVSSLPAGGSFSTKWVSVAAYGVLGLVVTLFGADVRGWRLWIKDWVADRVLAILP